MNPATPQRDLPRLIFGILFIALLLAASFWILKPFLLALVWATMIAVATWPLLLGVQRALRNSRKLAVLVMCAGLLLVLIVPLALAVATILQNVDVVKAAVAQLSAAGLPPLPAWVGDLPLVGERVAAMWAQAAAGGAEGLSARVIPYVDKMLAWLAGNAGSLGMVFVQFLLTLALTAVLYVKGEPAAHGLRRFFRRLAGEQGEAAVILAGKAIRAVAIGTVVTALLQGLLGGIGLWVAGVPGVLLLTAVMFLLAMAQIGVVPVLAAAVGWLFWKGSILWGGLLLVWTVVVASLDNVIRPVLIRRGADLPMLLILAGSIGGLVAFGIIGLFVGPVILAVSYTLVTAWVEQGDEGDEPSVGEETQ
ncbi:MAG: AI-2E family transporter YdiK [Deltaproteobacteria bacterium]|nr:MAG: AI-2E family transporter YdiK [Deltaproteobacteria bacterium]